MDWGIKRVLFTRAVLGSIASLGEAQEDAASFLQLWDTSLSREQTLQPVVLSALVFKIPEMIQLPIRNCLASLSVPQQENECFKKLFLKLSNVSLLCISNLTFSETKAE